MWQSVNSEPPVHNETYKETEGKQLGTINYFDKVTLNLFPLVTLTTRPEGVFLQFIFVFLKVSTHDRFFQKRNSSSQINLILVLIPFYLAL